MERKNSDMIIGLLVVAFILGGWQFFVYYKELTNTRKQLSLSRAEIEKANKENGELKAKINEKDRAIEEAKSQLAAVSQKTGALEKDNTELLREKLELEGKVAALEKEKREIEEKFHSLQELRKAIRQIKIEIHNQDAERYLEMKKRQKEIDAQKLLSGNRGYVVKDGKFTHKAGVKIEVKPGN